MVQKRDGSVEPFVAAKVLAGISHAVADRPVAPDLIEGVVRDVEAFAQEVGPLVASDDIGKRVLEGLRAIDEIAYLRFVSVHKEFEDARDFEREMAAMEDDD
jgi:transcriptional repressor NrdR